MNVFEEAEQVGFSVAEYCFVPALKEMADGAVFPIVVHGVGLIDALHDLGKGDVLGLDEQVNVIVHENVCINTAIGAVFIDREEQKILLEVRGISKYSSALIAAGDDVIECTFVFDAWFTRHAMRIENGKKKSTSQVLSLTLIGWTEWSDSGSCRLQVG